MLVLRICKKVYSFHVYAVAQKRFAQGWYQKLCPIKFKAVGCHSTRLDLCQSLSRRFHILLVVKHSEVGNRSKCIYFPNEFIAT